MTDLNISFEIFPPKADAPEDAARILAGVDRLRRLSPAFISLTYGAGASGPGRSERLMERLLAHGGGPNGGAGDLAGHLAAAACPAARARELAKAWWDGGLRHIVAIRGDAAGGDAAAADTFACAAELTEALRAVAPFEVSVAGYPEGHPKSASPAAEMDHLRRKVDAGATRVITQFFFEADVFLRYRDRCAAAGIAAPVAPGLLPVHSIAQAQRFAAACGASTPDWLAARFAGAEEPDVIHAITVATVAELARTLAREGVDAIHLYTLNRFRAAEAICRALDRPPAAAAGVPS